MKSQLVQKQKIRKPKILFRTSGGKAKGKELGLGHIYRSINLASYFKKSNVFFLIEDYGNVKKIIQSKNFKKISLLEKNISLVDDIEQTIDFIENYDIDILIIDKYKIKKKFIRELKKNIKVVVISDLNNIDYCSDLVFNGFVGFKNKSTKNKFGTKCFVGPNYQILDKRYSKKLKLTKKYDILATFGGFDEKNISKELVKTLYAYSYPIKAKIILGPASDFKIPSVPNNNKKISLDLIRLSTNLQKDINQSKFIICSGGITTYEISTSKIPFGIICQNNHQLITANEWEKRGIATNLGVANKQLHKKLSHLLNDIREKKLRLKNPSKNIVDGLGGKRVSDEIINNYYEAQF